MALGANRICTLLLIACDTHCYHNTMADLAINAQLAGLQSSNPVHGKIAQFQICIRVKRIYVPWLSVGVVRGIKNFFHVQQSAHLTVHFNTTQTRWTSHNWREQIETRFFRGVISH